MLVQMPRGPADPNKSALNECDDAFQAALRRDLASAPVVSYDSTLGGWRKRAFDLAVTVLSAPVWLPVLLVAAGVAKARHPARVFISEERVGYGGHVFQCFGLRMLPPMAEIARLHPVKSEDAKPANDWGVISQSAQDGRAKWRRLFERLPRLFNVLRGEMSLVGPSPLARDEVEPLKMAKRYYLSARPGVVGISSIAEANEEDAAQYKIYAVSWSLSVDALILSDAFRSARQRGTQGRALK